METISTQETVNEIAAKSKEIDIHLIAGPGTSTKEHCLGRVARHVTIPAYLQPAVLVNCPDSELMTIETYLNVAESQCFMTAQDLMDTLPAKPF